VRLTILERHGEVTLQDGGRPGWRKHGVPPAGPFCRFAARLANALCGNDADAPVLEVAGTVRARVEEPGWLAWDGMADLLVEGREAAGGGVRLEAGMSVAATAGRGSARLYLAAPGGWAGAPKLGSVAGRQEGSVLESRGPETPPTEMPAGWPLRPGSALRYVPLAGLGRLEGLRVSGRSSRAGIRLEGAPPSQQADAPSRPVGPGCIQRTPAGELVVLGPDGPTCGGYPLVGWMPRPDYEALAQAPAGQTLALAPVGEADALAASQRYEDFERRVLAAILASRT
jgi:allophanate hydrolase subunit 2